MLACESRDSATLVTKSHRMREPEEAIALVEKTNFDHALWITFRVPKPDFKSLKGSHELRLRGSAPVPEEVSVPISPIRRLARQHGSDAPDSRTQLRNAVRR